MNTNNYVIIIDPYSSGNQFAAIFNQLNCKVISVQSTPKPPDVYASSYQPEDFDKIYIANFEHLEELISQLRQYNPLCILTGCESGVELAEKLIPFIVPKYANIKELALARRDKGLMAKAVIDAGIPMMKQICSSDFAEVEQWLYSCKLTHKDLVIKPPKSASTDGVKKIQYGEGLEKSFYNLLNKYNRLGIINDRVIVQEYLYGTEYVVDTFSYNSIHTICSICKYTKLNNANGMAIYDQMEWVSPNENIVEVLTAYAEKVLGALGVVFGNSHIEIMLTKEGPRLIEIGARPHGGGHPRFCFIATGDSQIHRSARFFARKELPSKKYNLLKNMTIVFLHAMQSSVVKNVKKLDYINKLPSHLESNIKINNRQLVPATQDLFATLELGFIVLMSDDPLQIQMDIEKIRQIEMDVFVTNSEII